MKNKFTLLLFLTSFLTFAQDYQKELLSDVVVIKSAKFTANDYSLLTLSDGSTLQIKTYAEAPSTGVISRDNFVAFFHSIVTEILPEITDDKNATSKDLVSIIGNPDIEINCIMAKTGMQIEIKSDNGVKRITQLWADFFKE